MRKRISKLLRSWAERLSPQPVRNVIKERRLTPVRLRSRYIVSIFDLDNVSDAEGLLAYYEKKVRAEVFQGIASAGHGKLRRRQLEDGVEIEYEITVIND